MPPVSFIRTFVNKLHDNCQVTCNVMLCSWTTSGNAGVGENEGRILSYTCLYMCTPYHNSYCICVFRYRQILFVSELSVILLVQSFNVLPVCDMVLYLCMVCNGWFIFCPGRFTSAGPVESSRTCDILYLCFFTFFYIDFQLCFKFLQYKH